MNVFNNSKSLASTNTSSNIILKNSVREKETNKQSLSLLLNGNKIVNIQNNNSTLNANYCNINIKNKLVSLSQLSNNKTDKKLNTCNRTPSFTKTRIIDLMSNSEKKLNNNKGRSSIDLKNIHKKILFNYTANIKRAIVDNNMNLKITSSMYYNKRSNKNGIKANLNNIPNINSIGNDISNKHNKYNILLSKPNINNNENLYNKTLFNKTTNGLNQLNKKYNYNFNFLFKIKNNFEYCPFRPKIENKKQSSIMHKNKQTNIKHYEIGNSNNYINTINKNQNNNINVRSLDKEINYQKKHYYNNVQNFQHKSEKKQIFPHKIFSSTNNNNNNNSNSHEMKKRENRGKEKNLAKKGKNDVILIDLNNKMSNN